MYSKYKLEKKQVSTDRGVTWVDVVGEDNRRAGSKVGSYETFEDCHAIYRWTPIDEYVCVDKRPLQYFTIKSLEDGNEIKFISRNQYKKTISASTDNGETWTEYIAGATIATLDNGGEVLIKGKNSAYGKSKNDYTSFGSTKSASLHGNIMSLVNGDDFADSYVSIGDYAFFGLFYQWNNLKYADGLLLPVKELTPYCYSKMFRECYNLMTAPELRATTLATSCYEYMFYSCRKLTTAPELPARTLADNCYVYMFGGCWNLNYIKMLATDISAKYCLVGWVDNVSSSGTFVKASSMTSLPSGVNGIPNNWTVENV